ncbi:MAG: tyrosine-protein phosphatase [Coriobacteriales bacterium]|nr:tyrosine-protein phosphatase [Coriobacteriales bacterium]
MNTLYNMKSQSLGLEGIGNARELGSYVGADGKTVRRGVLLRTAMPSYASESDRVRLRDELHLTKVLDFRMRMEYDQSAAPFSTAHATAGSSPADPRDLDFADTEHVPILDEEQMMRGYEAQMQLLGDNPSPIGMVLVGVDGGFINERMYIEFLETEQGKRGYATFFRRLVEQPAGEALLYHCTQGKDRTGLASMLILSLLGVDEDTILFDYLLTNEFNAGIIQRERQALLQAGIPEEKLDTYMLGMDQVYEVTMRVAMDHLKQSYGSVWGYIHDALGVSEAERDALRDKYLEA